MDYDTLRLFVYKTDNGFITEKEDGSSSIRYYKGLLPHIDIWIREPDLWLWLLECNIFDVEGLDDTHDKGELMLITSISSIGIGKHSFNRFCSEHDFITSLIDKLDELSMDRIVSSDYIKLRTLEGLCHARSMNLLNFFYFLENGLPLEPIADFNAINTSASTYYRALDIILGAKDYSYRKLSRLTSISRENLLTDKSDSLKGKRKTIELRTLFRFTSALEISLTDFLSLCNWIESTSMD